MTHLSDLSYRLLASRFMRRQVRQLTEQLDGIRQGEDIECIHRARVASRRLRAALRMFCDCWGRKKIESWREQIRRITRSLGSARDKDVQIEFLCGMLGATADRAHVPGVARILAQAEQQRELLQPSVLEAVRRLEASKVLHAMQAATKKILASPAAEGIEPSDFTYDQTRQFVLQRLEQMLLDQDSLDDPDDYRNHHAMRIAAKRLRYTLEIAKPNYGGQLDGIIEATKKVQSLLGDVHDCDVWLRHLGTFAEEEGTRVQARFGSAGRFARLRPGIEYLQHERCERRQQVFQELVAYWQELKRQGMWERLAQIVETRGLAASVAESPAASAAPAVSPAEGANAPVAGPIAAPAENPAPPAPVPAAANGTTVDSADATPALPAVRPKTNGTSPVRPKLALQH